MAARTEEEITAGLLAMIAWAGNASAASSALEAEKGIKISSSTLSGWVRGAHALRYQEMREKYADQLEAQLIGDYRDLVKHALEAEGLAIEKARDRLHAGRDEDPGRTAANLARVAQANTDKMLSLSGRPTSIREDRNVEEILRSLAAKGVIQLPEPPVEIEAGDG